MTLPMNPPNPWYRWYDPRMRALVTTATSGAQPAWRQRVNRYPSMTVSSSTPFINADSTSTGIVHQFEARLAAATLVLMPRARAPR